MTEQLQKQIAHLQMAQGVITRMETNCFTLKTLAVSFVAGALTFISVKTDRVVLIIATLAIWVLLGLFWYLDARYLRLGRQMRRLYKDVADGVTMEPFTLDPKPYENKVDALGKTATSWSVAEIYTVLMVFMALAAFLTNYFQQPGGDHA